MCAKQLIAKGGKYLVVSFDPDQGQWFWDFVSAGSEGRAKAFILKQRPYVECADAVTASELAVIAGKLEAATHTEIVKRMQAVIEENPDNCLWNEKGERVLPSLPVRGER